ncbi:MAG: DUF2069 domain-containing protein [Pseudomonas sp.]
MSKADKPLPTLDYLQSRIRISRLLAGLGYAGLLACLFIYNAFIADLHGANPVVIVGVLLVPLLIFLPGIAMGHIRTHAWLCFAINLYFIYGVQTCFVAGKEVYGGILVGTTVLYFIAALMFVRWSYQAQRVKLNLGYC